jgi:hypothetical protein
LKQKSANLVFAIGDLLTSGMEVVSPSWYSLLVIYYLAGWKWFLQFIDVRLGSQRFERMIKEYMDEREELVEGIFAQIWQNLGKNL